MLSQWYKLLRGVLLRYEDTDYSFLLYTYHHWLTTRFSPSLFLFSSSLTCIDTSYGKSFFPSKGHLSPKAVLHRLVPLLLIFSMTFHHVPGLGPCAYPRSIKPAPFCTYSLKLGLTW